MYVIFPTHVSTKEPLWFHAFVLSQKKVRHYVTFHNTVMGSCIFWYVLRPKLAIIKATIGFWSSVNVLFMSWKGRQPASCQLANRWVPKLGTHLFLRLPIILYWTASCQTLAYQIVCSQRDQGLTSLFYNPKITTDELKYSKHKNY